MQSGINKEPSSQCSTPKTRHDCDNAREKVRPKDKQHSDTNLGPGHIYPKRAHMKIAKRNKIREPMLELV